MKTKQGFNAYTSSNFIIVHHKTSFTSSSQFTQHQPQLDASSLLFLPHPVNFNLSLPRGKSSISTGKQEPMAKNLLKGWVTSLEGETCGAGLTAIRIQQASRLQQ